MSKSLVIVESPAKARTITKFLGKGYAAKSSYGHLRDLPKKEMGIDFENDFKPTYKIILSKSKVIRELKKEAKKADRVFLATDPDREGEAISWHLAEILNMPSKIKRAVFYEITKDKVLEAIANAQAIDTHKVLAQQARRLLDRIVGYKISPILWSKIGRGLSAGRVQSVAMRLILEREKKIKNFIPDEYWSIIAGLRTEEKIEFEAKLFKVDEKKPEIKKEADALEIINRLKGCDFIVGDIEKKEQKRNATPPFTTSLLQQEAARKLGFTAYRTMRLAQQLYEGAELGEEGPTGLITYMRTDSFRINSDFRNAARTYIKDKFGENFVPEKPNYFASRKGAQEAHEAIRPTSLNRPPELIKSYLNPDQWKLYDLIWRRFLASQMTQAIFDETVVFIESGPAIFRVRGQVIRFLGFMAVYEEGKEDEEGEDKKEQMSTGCPNGLPLLTKEEKLFLLKFIPEQHFTKPPAPYSEAMLVKALEEEGIGRPSTYATIIHTIEEREYINRIKRKLYPTELGLTVTELLIDSFPKIMDIKFTAGLEDRLDTIEEGKEDWIKILRDFYDPFIKSVEKAEKEMKNLKKERIETDVKCLRCGELMIMRWGRHGKFLACSTYPKCRHTQDLQEGGVEQSEKKCKECGGTLLIKNGKFGRFLACIQYPECKFTEPMGTGIKCTKENCSGEIIERRTKRGRGFYGCSKFPACDFFSWKKPQENKNIEKDEKKVEEIE